MASVCFYFHVHQPYRLKNYRVFDIGNDHDYFHGEDDQLNKDVLRKVASKCYLPTNRLLLQLLEEVPDFRISFSITGILLDQLAEYAPQVITSFQKLVDTGRVEILSETYYHSLAFLYSRSEFRNQVKKHNEKILNIFGVTPTVFRNTELIYNNDLASEVAELGYKGIITEGADHILQGRSPNYIYSPQGQEIKVLLKNYKLSDDIAFRFSSVDWKEHPLTAPKFADWVSAVNGTGDIVNLFMDYETFGEHQWEHTGIFNFLRELPTEILKHPDNNFVTPSEAMEALPVRDSINVPDFISWADIERDLSAWLSNSMQMDAIKKLYALEPVILASKDSQLIEDWRRLQTSDHFYYMCTKWFADGDVHKYFSHYDSPYDAFLTFMNVINDIKLRVSKPLLMENKTHKITKS